MTAAPGLDEPPLLWRGDPTVIVYAVRHVLEHPGSHAPELVAQAVLLNVRRLPDPARRVLRRAITSWIAEHTESRRQAPAMLDLWRGVLEALGPVAVPSDGDR